MIQKLKQYFEQHLMVTDEAELRDDEHKLRLACAALMLEMIHADHRASEDELMHLQQLLQQQFRLDPAEAGELIGHAREERRHATDYYQFTTLINDHYSQQQKRELIFRLWQLAWTDDRIHKLEEHLVRKLADLLHVPHASFIQSKHKAKR